MRAMDVDMATLRAAPRGLRERLGPGKATAARNALLIENEQLRAKYLAAAAKCDRMAVQIGTLQEQLAHAQSVIGMPFGYVVDGPHGRAHVPSIDDVEICIATLCRGNGDDPDDYTATEVFALDAGCCAVATCIECGCDDLHACADGCSWLRVDRETGLGLCSMCANRLTDWDAGNRTVSAQHIAGGPGTGGKLKVQGGG